MDYQKTRLNILFEINDIVSFHYYEFSKYFIFPGERHDFWEMIYVDKGEVGILSDENVYELKQGDIIFHKPNEFHGIRANKVIPPNLIAISFDCKSPALKTLEGKIFHLNDRDRNILSNIVAEAFNTFKAPLDSPDIYLPLRKDNPPFESEHLIKIYLELLIITLIRNDNNRNMDNMLSSQRKEKEETEFIHMTVGFLKDHIEQWLSLQQIADQLNVSKTHLTKIFRKYTGIGVIEYFKKLKIEQAKVLIREENLNVSEIADKLGYSSVHYFSKHFKKITATAPSEYAKTVKSRVLL